MTTFAIDPSEKYSGYALAHGREVLWYGEIAATIRELDRVINELRGHDSVHLVAERIEINAKDPMKSRGILSVERAVGRWELALEQSGYLRPLQHVERFPIVQWHKFVRESGFPARTVDGKQRFQKAAARLLASVTGRPVDVKHHNAACAAAIALACESKRAGGDLFAWAT